MVNNPGPTPTALTRATLTAATLAAATLAVPGFAHDLWLEPSAFRTEMGSTQTVRIRVGEQFRGDPVARDPGRIVRFASLAPRGGESPIPGVAGLDPAGFFRPKNEGVHLIGYLTRPSSVLLRPATFERYLREEGLERIVALREAAGESGEPGREAFSRCAKALVAVGSGRESAFGRLLGCRFELVPATDPQVTAAGERLSIRVLFDGRPLAGTLVVALSASDPQAGRSTRSDTGGIATFDLDAPGPWLIKAVHMEPGTPALEADWQSWWASLTFALPAE